MMVGLSGLWLPILLSGVAVFIISSVIHMGPFWHRTDYPKLANEDAVLNALRPLSIPPGDYMAPRAMGMAEMKSPGYLEKLNKGPVLMMTVMPSGPFNMGKQLTQWFVYSLAVGVLVAYATGRALPLGAEYLRVFRIAGVTAFLAYNVALWQMSIWYHRPWSLTIKWTVDGLLYALATAGMFGWLWPR